MNTLLWILRIFLIVAVAIFAAQNWLSVPLRFLNLYLELPLVFWVVAIFILGIVFGVSVMLPKMYQLHQALKKHTQKENNGQSL